jgi:hypothetical protein
MQPERSHTDAKLSRRFTPITLVTLLLTCFASFVIAQGVGFVQVIAEPGITVLVDGQVAGVTTANEGGLAIVDVPVGERRLTFERPGVAIRTETITVTSGRVTVVNVGALRAAAGRIVIQCLPVCLAPGFVESVV